jgi:hypothetical protein
VGPPPGDILYEGDLLSRSLMERAGLQRPTVKKTEELGSTISDMPVIVVPETPAPNPQRGKKDFFSQLKFD